MYAHDTSKLVQEAENLLECFQVLNTHPNNAVRMVSTLAGIIVSKSMKHIDTALALQFCELLPK